MQTADCIPGVKYRLSNFQSADYRLFNYFLCYWVLTIKTGLFRLIVEKVYILVSLNIILVSLNVTWVNLNIIQVILNNTLVSQFTVLFCLCRSYLISSWFSVFYITIKLLVYIYIHNMCHFVRDKFFGWSINEYKNLWHKFSSQWQKW